MTTDIRDAPPFINKLRDVFLNETMMLRGWQRLSCVNLLPQVALAFSGQQAMASMQLRRMRWIVNHLYPALDLASCVPAGVQPMVDDMDAVIRHEMSPHEREWRLLVIALQARTHEIKTYNSALALLAPLNDTLAAGPLLRENLIGKLRGKDQLIELQQSLAYPLNHEAITSAVPYEISHSEGHKVLMGSF